MKAFVLHHASVAFATQAVGWFFVGTLLGLSHFLSLRRNIRCLAAGQILLALGLQLFRFSLTGAALAFVAYYFGAIPLLAGTFGLVIARTFVLRWEPQP